MSSWKKEKNKNINGAVGYFKSQNMPFNSNSIGTTPMKLSNISFLFDNPLKSPSKYAKIQEQTDANESCHAQVYLYW